jgi:DNA-directed RNA polymerase specialized sigma24 family protein
MRYWMELSEEEIAAALGISPGAVKTHAHRARQALAARLGDRFDEE